MDWAYEIQTATLKMLYRIEYLVLLMLHRMHGEFGSTFQVIQISRLWGKKTVIKLTKVSQIDH